MQKYFIVILYFHGVTFWLLQLDWFIDGLVRSSGIGPCNHYHEEGGDGIVDVAPDLGYEPQVEMVSLSIVLFSLNLISWITV
ncbi:hypothetical protein HYC85_004156 [Camellia sinensis]|uniref:Uncharacterized protein n=1 Tax=Camellia sinensis TaxID=4442 RepID=A0A7J7HXG1_CAMSI|nr:hypothetical protein HYC85_004156 [Camellia sinensis]